MSPSAPPSARPARARRPGRAAARERRGVALILVLATITVLTVVLAEFQDEASTESMSVLAERDALRAEYAARSAVNLGRLLVAAEPTIRQAIGPLLGMMMGGGGTPQIPIWEFSDRILGAFNDAEGNAAFGAIAGVDITTGRNLGMKGVRFDLIIVDEESKLNLNMAAKGDAVAQQRLSLEVLGLLQGDQYNPLFENRDAEGQFSDRQTICGALIDWADGDESLNPCDPRNAQATSTGGEDAFYQGLSVPYRRKNAAFDSLGELHLVRGVSDDFYATFLDPDPDDPRRRVVTVWGTGAVNVNTANAQTLLAIVCGAAQPNTPMCVDPLIAQKFLTAVGLMRGFTSGAPVFPSPKSFVNAMQGKGMFGQVLKDMLGIEPVQFLSANEVQRMVTNESKMFSLYAEGQVKGYRREARVRAQAVVDFRPGAQVGLAAGAPAPAPTATATTTATATGTATGAAGSSGAPAVPTGPTAGPEGAGTLVYFRIE
jgi:general secretion pathway protein K